jgi:hypothetical protein
VGISARGCIVSITSNTSSSEQKKPPPPRTAARARWPAAACVRARDGLHTFHTHIRRFFNHFHPRRFTGHPPTHDGLGGAALVRRFKTTHGLKPSHKAGRSASLPVLPVFCQNWQTDNWTTKILSTPPRPIHRWKALGETVTTVVLHVHINGI